MHTAPGTQVVAQGSLAHLKEIQGVLARHGIPAELVHPPKGQCGS
jgi:hypothetical protein